MAHAAENVDPIALWAAPPPQAALHRSIPQPLAAFDLSPTRGCLPAVDPLRRLPPAFEAWETLAADLPALLAGGGVRAAVGAMPLLDVSLLPESGGAAERANLLLAHVAHAYVWERSGEPADRLPARLAVPWDAVARRAGAPLVMSYAARVRHNWRRLDPAGPIDLSNLAILQPLAGGHEEELLVLSQVAAEAAAGAAYAAALAVCTAAGERAVPRLLAAMAELSAALERMAALAVESRVGVDVAGQHRRVGRLLAGWDALPGGLLFEQVGRFAGVPQRFAAGGFEQSPIVPVLRALADGAEVPAGAAQHESFGPGWRALLDLVEHGGGLPDLVRTLGAGRDAEAAAEGIAGDVDRFFAAAAAAGWLGRPGGASAGN